MEQETPVQESFTYIEEFFPVRCVTCSKLTGAYEEKFNELLKKGFSTDEALDKLGLFHTCCRMSIKYPQKIPMAPRLPNQPIYKFISETIKKKSQSEVEQKATTLREKFREQARLARESKGTAEKRMEDIRSYMKSKQEEKLVPTSDVIKKFRAV
jgi:DNA-directed RNA polymerase subunit N (RpoN/RPB10)